MGKSQDNLWTDGFTGKMGKNMVFRQKKSGKIIVAKGPRKTRNPLTAISIAIREKFTRGVAYAKAIMDQEIHAPLKAKYAAAVKGDQSAYNLALRDAIKSPEVTQIDTIEYIGVPGNIINILAKDDFHVVAVSVSIHSESGQLIEEGNAVLDSKGMKWIYTATQVNNPFIGSTITATAFDNPDNKGTVVATL